MILPTIIASRKNMIDLIETFLATKELSKASKSAYRYDLLQFVDIVNEKMSSEKMRRYQFEVSGLSDAARRRKFSTVNQFLYFLYQISYLKDYFHIDEKVRQDKPKPELTDTIKSVDFLQESGQKRGQLIALLILELGLLPNEIANLKVENCLLALQMVKIETNGQQRVLEIPQKLLPLMEIFVNQKQVYLFDHQGKTFSRQWFYKELKAFLKSLELEEVTAQDLRRHFIMKEKSKGKSILAISQQLGLKSPVTLEKYFKD